MSNIIIKNNANNAEMKISGQSGFELLEEFEQLKVTTKDYSRAGLKTHEGTDKLSNSGVPIRNFRRALLNLGDAKDNDVKIEKDNDVKIEKDNDVKIEKDNDVKIEKEAGIITPLTITMDNGAFNRLRNLFAGKNSLFGDTVKAMSNLLKQVDNDVAGGRGRAEKFLDRVILASITSEGDDLKTKIQEAKQALIDGMQPRQRNLLEKIGDAIVKAWHKLVAFFKVASTGIKCAAIEQAAELKKSNNSQNQDSINTAKSMAIEYTKGLANGTVPTGTTLESFLTTKKSINEDAKSLSKEFIEYSNTVMTDKDSKAYDEAKKLAKDTYVGEKFDGGYEKKISDKVSKLKKAIEGNKEEESSNKNNTSHVGKDAKLSNLLNFITKNTIQVQESKLGYTYHKEAYVKEYGSVRLPRCILDAYASKGGNWDVAQTVRLMEKDIIDEGKEIANPSPFIAKLTPYMKDSNTEYNAKKSFMSSGGYNTQSLEPDLKEMLSDSNKLANVVNYGSINNSESNKKVEDHPEANKAFERAQKTLLENSNSNSAKVG